jgi:dissimilatory sulfite reductase (desulfoviridin) alpha/beta subunit
MPTRKRYRCRYCNRLLPAWLPVAQRPDGAMLLGHVSQHHPTELKPYLERMRTEKIATVAAEAYEVVEEEA